MYIRCMTAARINERLRQRRRSKEAWAELFVPKRVPRGRKPRTMQLQWYDGAGELQYAELTPAQSWPYLIGH